MSDLVPDYNLDIKQGGTRTFTVTVMDNNENAINLTSYTAALQIRSKPGNVLISGLTSTPAAGITINAVLGEVVIAWTAAQTLEFNFERAVYDLFITSGAGIKTCILQGDVILYKRVTQ